MNRRLTFPLIIGVFLAIALTFFNVKMQSFDLEKYNFGANQLVTLKQAHNQAYEEIYKIRAGARLHYDTLTRVTKSMKEVSKNLNTITINLAQQDDERTTEVLKALEYRLEAQIQEIETFKLRHATIKNSLDYLPKITEEAASQYGDIDAALLDEIRHLMHLTLFYVQTSDKEWAKKSRALHDDLTQQHAHKLVQHILAHTKLIRDGTDEMNAFLAGEGKIEFEEIIDTLQYTYGDYHRDAVNEMNQYRLLMYIISVTLLVLVIYIMFLFSRNALTLFRERERAHVTLTSIGSGVIVTDRRGVVEFMNHAAENFTGWSSMHAIGSVLDDVVEIHDDGKTISLNKSINECIACGEPIELNDKHLLLKRANDQDISIMHSIAPIRDHDHRIVGAVLVFDDVSEAQRLTKELQWHASHDPLTGLVNRREFETRLKSHLHTARVEELTHTLLFLDLDQFKVVNDTCGHLAGDRLLIQITDLFKNLLRSGDTLARLGGDEFAILLPSCPVESAKLLSEEILQAIQSFTFEWDGKPFKIGVSIGLLPINKHSGDITTIMSAADVACYAAKDGGRNRVHIYLPSDEDTARHHNEMNWVSILTEALQEDRFVLYGQTIMPLEEQLQKEPHMEVLIRLQDESGAIVLPGAFLPAAERYNMMSTIDRWVISNSFSHYNAFRKMHGISPRLSINLSGASFNDRQMLRFIVEQFMQYRVNPEDICFEITETVAIAQMRYAMIFINTLKKAGCKFALDDFGSGLSSFGYLKNLPVDYIKIDGNFVKDIEGDRLSQVMVQMISNVGKVMDIKIIAESAEDDNTLDILKELGIDYAQGYGINQPYALSMDQLMPKVDTTVERRLTEVCD